MRQPVSFTDPGIDVACPKCDSVEVEEDEDEVEETDGRCYRIAVLVCLECGKVFR